ncbi:hypothetical protein [Natronospira bacteriovora]|uniref:Uncharacterized protein n=1 Tax=Natronospira bacteriovora TaxID=3069753 RepID=A0ABU0W5N2_9GAMM|nr:hypothetical protein [Natronospira sp. AB-CW4]MDQ2069326.1 hypothetical protein [Natronospira sp. AB-CW4]
MDVNQKDPLDFGEVSAEHALKAAPIMAKVFSQAGITAQEACERLASEEGKAALLEMGARLYDAKVAGKI